MVRRDSENCHLNLSLSAVCDCGISSSSPIKVSFKIFIYYQYDLTSNKTQSGFVYFIEAQDIFQGKCW